MKHRYTALPLAVLVLALAAFTGSAFAGGGNGNGSSGSDSHGNSANAPGQTKQAPAAPVASADNSTGVKPSSTTAHGAHNTTAPASSNATKQYGNGKTAGQIATQAGYGSATLYGPGNSQPHKYLCGGHEVDVHALAHKGNKCGSTTPKTLTPSASEAATCTTVTRTVTEHVLVAGTSHGQGAEHANAHAQLQSKAHYETVTKTESVPTGANCSSSTPTVISTQVVSSAPLAPLAPAVSAGAVAPAIAAATVTPTASASAPAVASTTATPAAVGAVKGAVMTLKSTKTKPAGGVLGATTRLGHTVAASRLPFTGLPLWPFALVAAGLIATGVGVRRTASRRI